MKTCVRGVVAAIALAWCAAGAAADDQAEIDAIYQKAVAYVTAYNQHDAQALADLWADDAVYLNRDTGEPIEGRSAIAAMFAGMFQTGEASQLSVTVQSVRLVTPDVAIEDGTAEITSTDGEPVTSTYTAIHVKKDGAWYLNSVRETDMPAQPAQDHGQLSQLEWLVGEWVDQADDATVHTSWKWAKNERFLAGNFSVSLGDRVELEGTQVIGWDPVAGEIRSWMFDSEGGFGEGVWSRVGGDWIVETTSTLNDGSQGSATNVYTPIDENTFVWKSVDREIDGEPQDDLEQTPVHRLIEVASSDAVQEQTTDGGN
jgi:uncharacterized protein (TIGR02246 family)